MRKLSRWLIIKLYLLHYLIVFKNFVVADLLDTWNRIKARPIRCLLITLSTSLTVWYLYNSDERVIKARIESSAVYLETPGVGSGSGVVIKSSWEGSFILTNKHICKHNIPKDAFFEKSSLGVATFYPMRVQVVPHKEKGYAQVLRIDQNSDLCLMYTAMPNLSPAVLAKESPDYGDTVYGYGSPKNMQGVFDKGEVISYDFQAFMLTQVSSLHVYPGSSGSGVFNYKGELVGLANFMFAGPIPMETTAGAVPLPIIKAFLGNLDL